MAKLDVKAFGLTMGILWGASVIFMTLAARFTGYGAKFINALGTVYIGSSVSIKGSLIGGGWGLVDGFFCGLIFAWLYNKLAK
ncbi:MAG: bacteriophage holin [Candidatus Omnitrophica bacterium]|nr:bacteriophage holin [Candidatus Omnitrophota bacterium]